MNYVGWRFMAKFARHASARFEQHFENFQTTAIGQEELPNWKRCLLDTAEVMPFAVGRLYAELKQWEATDFKVHELVLNLISSLDHMLQEFNWVQGVTKQKAKTILSSANIAVGYPEWILDNKALDQYYEEIPENGVYLSLYEHALRNRFIHQLNINNSYSRIPTKMAHFIFPTKMVELHQRSGHLRETLFYDIRENTFVIPSGVFSAPYYNPDLTWAMNYGGLGTLVARDVISEFFHAADARWMTETDRHVYRNGSQCVLRAIGKRSQRIPEEALLHCSSLVRSLLSLRLTYNAYHLHLGVQDEATLPGLEDMSPDQVFFVAAFRTLCTQIRELHFVPVVHLNGTVTELDYLDGLMRGMNEFTDAFSCNKLRDMPNVVQQCLAPSSPAAKLRARKRTLWHPPAMHFTTPDNPVLTTERRTAYRRNRTVFKRPYHHIQP
ncbi:hypothetical protein HPB47_002662 [Ixodes persulcatus]|uniref:Uncharacterized protein n=1 Tax=Ixodes persulcatus TaxID=34615 RepID=A0AC60PLK0_IXOPE|nr:hypothetical protein HPB47_002662 [Ixodes persulcatus]